MKPRIAIPVPHSQNVEYAAKTLPEYERAVELAGGVPVRIPLDRTPTDVMKIIEQCDAVLLPGSRADIDPAKYDVQRDPKTEPPDAGRDMVDELLLQDAYNMRKPVLGICYGLQMLNVYRSGTLKQHIDTTVDHTARTLKQAHTIRVDPVSKLAGILSSAGVRMQEGPEAAEVSVNSSHHQAAEVVGDGLRVVARAPDGIIEALEGTAADHFVLAVQWHPERTMDEATSEAILRALVEAAEARREKLDGEFESLPR
jgi:putative glutamine amidotransferase